MSPWHIVLVALAGWLNREQQKIVEYLKEENRVLREQLGTKRLRFNDEQRRRLAVKGKELGIKVLRELGCIVTPDTIIRWYRELIAMKYDGSEHRRPGRPKKPDELRELVATMARDNPGWGYTRIRDALANLGHEMARNTIKAILKAQGIEPAPERSKRTSWKTFLRAHWDAIAACDFFTVEVLTWTGLTRFYVLFVIELETRRVEIAGIIRQPHGAWMLLTPSASSVPSRASASTSSSFSARLIYAPLSASTSHCHRERNHQGLDSQLISPPANLKRSGPIVCRERLGGVLRFYDREAA